jgi:hypothetical protein
VDGTSYKRRLRGFREDAALAPGVPVVHQAFGIRDWVKIHFGTSASTRVRTPLGSADPVHFNLRCALKYALDIHISRLDNRHSTLVAISVFPFISRHQFTADSGKTRTEQ